MRTSPTTTDQRALARRTGMAYLGIIATGVFAEFAVRGSLVVEDDAVATARNIADAPALFGVGIGADLVMVALDVVVALGLLRLLRDVSERRARLATGFRLVQGGVIALNLVNLVTALRLADRAVGADGAIAAGPAADVLAAVERHALGYDLGLVAFGVSSLVLGRLLSMVPGVSRLLAVGMVVTGGVYLVGSFAALFAPDLSTVIDPFYGIAFVVELAFAIRLITRGLAPRPLAAPVPVAA